MTPEAGGAENFGQALNPGLPSPKTSGTSRLEESLGRVREAQHPLWVCIADGNCVEPSCGFFLVSEPIDDGFATQTAGL
jgi:hypothetical protein